MLQICMWQCYIVLILVHRAPQEGFLTFCHNWAPHERFLTFCQNLLDVNCVANFPVRRFEWILHPSSWTRKQAFLFFKNILQSLFYIVCVTFFVNISDYSTWFIYIFYNMDIIFVIGGLNLTLCKWKAPVLFSLSRNLLWWWNFCNVLRMNHNRGFETLTSKYWWCD